MMGLVISHAQSLFVSPLLFKCSKQYYFENTQNIIIWHSELRLNIDYVLWLKEKTVLDCLHLNKYEASRHGGDSINHCVFMLYNQ